MPQLKAGHTHYAEKTVADEGSYVHRKSSEQVSEADAVDELRKSDHMAPSDQLLLHQGDRSDTSSEPDTTDFYKHCEQAGKGDSFNPLGSLRCF